MRTTKKYKSLPYNPNLLTYAKELRKAGILHEVLLWNQLKSKKLNDLDFDRQKIIGNYIVDFYCAERSTVIEIDGISHVGKESYDARRDEYLQGLGLTVIHLMDVDVLRNIEGVIAFLRNNPALKVAEGTTPPPKGGTPP